MVNGCPLKLNQLNLAGYFLKLGQKEFSLTVKSTFVYLSVHFVFKVKPFCATLIEKLQLLLQEQHGGLEGHFLLHTHLDLLTS